MFELTAQLLTLLAFTAHVVGGCCAHHGHAQPATHAVECDGVHHAGHVHQTSPHAAIACRTPENVTDSFPRPCHGEHLCSETACTYLTNEPLQLQTQTEWTFFSSPKLLAAQCCLKLPLPGHSPGRLPPSGVTALFRCALLETWLV